jgi:hypothetical protein
VEQFSSSRWILYEYILNKNPDALSWRHIVVVWVRADNIGAAPRPFGQGQSRQSLPTLIDKNQSRTPEVALENRYIDSQQA